LYAKGLFFSLLILLSQFGFAAEAGYFKNIMSSPMSKVMAGVEPSSALPCHENTEIKIKDCCKNHCSCPVLAGGVPGLSSHVDLFPAHIFTVSQVIETRSTGAVIHSPNSLFKPPISV